MIGELHANRWVVLAAINLMQLVAGLLPAARRDHPDDHAGPHAGDPGLCMVLAIVILCVFPGLATWLPSKVMG